MSHRINEIESSTDSNDFNHPNIDKKSFMAFKREQKELEKEEKRKKLYEINCLIEKYEKNDKKEIQNQETKNSNDVQNNDQETYIQYTNNMQNDQGCNTNKKKDITQKNEMYNSIDLHTDNNIDMNKLHKMKEKLEFDLSEKVYETESNTCIYNQAIQESEDDQIQLIIQLLNNNNPDDFITIIDNAKINLESLQDLVLYNLSEQIKEGNDEIGIELTRLGIFVKYGIESGKSFVYKMKEALKDENKREMFEKEVKLQYKASKEAILGMQDE